MRSTSHLVMRGSDRRGEDYEVRRRSDGQRIGWVEAPYSLRRRWLAVADDGRQAAAGTMRDAVLLLWPAPEECEV